MIEPSAWGLFEDPTVQVKCFRTVISTQQVLNMFWVICSIPGLGRSPSREGNGNTLHYSFLGNSMDRGTWWVTVQVVAKESDST